MPLLRFFPLFALAAAPVVAQLASEAVNPPGKPTLDQLKAAAAEAEARLPEAKSEPKGYFDLSDAQRARLNRYLPRTLLKLNRRERLHVVVIGDTMLDGSKADANLDPLLTSFAGVFAKRLTTQFYYTGGVRIVRPGSSFASKERSVMGPEIVLQPVRASSMVQAAAALTSEGLQGRPDIVLVALGFEDALAGTPLDDVEAGLRGLIGAAEASKIEVLVAGPMLQAAEPAEQSLALTRGVASLLREVCDEEDILFSDLADLSREIAPPQGLAEGFRSFPLIARQYQTLLEVAPDGLVSPASTALHLSMGSILFEDLLDGVPSVPWSVGKATGTAGTDGTIRLTVPVKNDSKAPLTLTVLPLPTSELKLQDATPEIQLAPGASKDVSVTCALKRAPQSDVLRLPLLVVAGSVARLHDLVVPVLPVGVNVNSRTTFNHEGVFNPVIEVSNPAKTKIDGTWEAEFRGRKLGGKLALGEEGSEVLDLKLDLDLKADMPVRQKLPLKLQIDAAGQKRDFSRQIEIVRNLGLKQPATLSAVDGRPAEAKLRFDADSQRFFVICDLEGIDLNNASGDNAFDITLHIDARRYGQRLTPGATAGIRIRGQAADGAAKVDKLAVWAFGTGYAATYDEKEIKAALSSTAAGVRRVTISLPRSYLYDHEWALNNGNSQLGVNFTLDAGGRSYFLTSSSRHPDDAESLAVLELTDKPTPRATIRVD